MRVSVGPPGSTGEEPRASSAWAVLLGVPLTAVVVVGLWTPTALRTALEQVVLVLGGGRG
jgi:hypothetical protein